MIKHYITERNRELLIKVYLIIEDITTRMENMFRHNQQGIRSCIYDMTFCGPYRPLDLQNVSNDVSFTLQTVGVASVSMLNASRTRISATS